MKAKKLFSVFHNASGHCPSQKNVWFPFYLNCYWVWAIRVYKQFTLFLPLFCIQLHLWCICYYVIQLPNYIRFLSQQSFFRPCELARKQTGPPSPQKRFITQWRQTILDHVHFILSLFNLIHMRRCLPLECHLFSRDVITYRVEHRE